MDVFIETPRLYIRPLEAHDAHGMQQMEADPEVHKYIGKKPVDTLEHSRYLISFIQSQYVAFGIGRWAVIEKGTDDFVGWVGHKLMNTMVNGHINYYDFGYRLTRKHWNKGYATEVGHAALHYGINTLGFKNICAMTDIANAASRRVLEKLGFIYKGNFPYDAEPTWRTVGEPTAWYEYEDIL